MDGAVEWVRLAAPAPAGSSTLTLDRAGGLLGILPSSSILIGAGLATWDWKFISPVNISNNIINLGSPLTNSHSANEVVGIFASAEPVKFSWIGGISGDSSQSAADRNVALFNRFASFGGVGVQQSNVITLALDGSFYTSDICKLWGSQVALTGISGDSRRDGLVAHSSFPFQNDYSKSMLTVQDQHGTGVGYDNPRAGGDIATWITHIFLDGASLANSIGLVHIPQQPGYATGLFVKNFTVLGYYFGLQNCWWPDKIVGENNAWTLHAEQVIYGIADVQVKNPMQVNGMSKAVKLGGLSGAVDSITVTGQQSPGPCVEIEGPGHAIQNIHTEGFSSAPGTLVEILGGAAFGYFNLKYDQVHPSVKIVRDAVRNFSLVDGDIYGRSLRVESTNDHDPFFGVKGVRYKSIVSGGVLTDVFAGEGAPHAA